MAKCSPEQVECSFENPVKFLSLTLRKIFAQNWKKIENRQFSKKNWSKYSPEYVECTFDRTSRKK